MSAAAAAAAVAATAAAAAAAGASAGSVFVKRSDDARARFAPVEIFVGDAVGHLTKRASLERRWGVDAAYVDLFLVKPDGDDEPTAAEEEAALTQPRLQVGWLLSRARISSGAWVLARLPDPPAAAPGECARAARSLLSCSPSRGAGGARGTCERFRRGLRGGAHPFPPSLLSSYPSQAAAAAATRRLQPAVALRQLAASPRRRSARLIFRGPGGVGGTIPVPSRAALSRGAV